MSRNIKSSAELSPISAYTLEYEENLDDFASLGLVFRHKKSGARVCVISNDDKNKVYYIGFRTPVRDDTGVPHIIEHTVLCGSDKYPSRDPFMLLAKGSLNTFLNAMTYPDKTVYPVASCNDKDFDNLMSVYTDAVFHPNIYKHREIFMQEGWHYELEKPGDELKINGIVYNEMKGVLSSPDSSIFDEVCKAMFPDTTYGRNSGGDPTSIPELTYESYLDFHRKHYNPSNSYIFLWGDIDIEERLDWLDENYLSDYSLTDVSGIESELQKPLGGLRRVTSYYSVEPEEGGGTELSPDDERTYFAYSAGTCVSLDAEECVAWDIIAEVLVNTPGAPIRQALLDAGIGQDVFGGILDHLRQSGVYVVAKNAKKKDKEKFLSIVTEGFRKASEGIDRVSLEAAINSREFAYREADYGSTPKGLCCGLDMLQSWLYDDRAAFTYMRGGEIYRSLRAKLGTGWFESLIARCILKSEHSALLSYEPVPGLIDSIDGKLAARLAEYKASLTEDEVNAIIEDTRALHKYQSAPSTKEEQSCIPCLSRDELEREALPLSNSETEIGGVKAVIHDGFTGGIAYVNLYFDIDDFAAKWLPYIGQLGDLLGRMDTEKHSYLDLANEIKLNIGRLSFAPLNINLCDGEDRSRLMFAVRISCFESKIGKALELVSEIISGTKLGHTKRLRELLGETRSDMQSRIMNRGNAAAAGRLMSYFSRSSARSEWIGGISAYNFICSALDSFGNSSDSIARTYKALCESIFARPRLLMSVCCGDEGMKALRDYIPEFASGLSGEALLPSEDNGYFPGLDGDILKPERKNEGFMLSSQVQFVGMGGNIKSAGFKYTGVFKVLENILNCEYLYNSVRVLGGAYGCNSRFGGTTGNMFFVSFRDPHIKNTEKVYRGVPEFIKGLDPDDESLTRYIIGTFSGLDRPMSVHDMADRSMSAYLSGMTYEMLCAERAEIIEATAEQLRACAPALEAVIEQNYRCTLGNAKKLRDSSDDFEKLIMLS